MKIKIVPNPCEIAIFEYRCRRCGGLFSSYLECNAERADNTMVSNIITGELPKTLLHKCQYGGSGLGDLAGYSTKKEE